MILIGLLNIFSSMLVLSREKKWCNWLARKILVVSRRKNIWGLEPSRAILNNEIIFGGTNHLQA
jgi:hypothetical protein